MQKYLLILAIIITGTLACKNDQKNVNEPIKAKPRATVPRVSPDSSFAFIKDQLRFGVRVPGTQGHADTKEWIVNKMKAYGANVEIQEFKASFLGKKDVLCYNIIAKINPEIKERVALFAHWDTRLIAEKDNDLNQQDKPIMGAVDGASGVAGLMEIARLIAQNPIDLGIDFVFFDAEDQGEESNSESWCLGSQYWAKTVVNQDNKPKFGILLDLIGAKNATYSKEEISRAFAGELVDKIWNLAQGMGKGSIFVSQNIGSIVDDHYYINSIAKIPTVDIIETLPSGQFASYHHTHADDEEAIDPTNLSAVIQVVTAVIYKTSDGTF